MLNKKYIRIPLQVIIIMLSLPLIIIGAVVEWFIRLLSAPPAKTTPQLIDATPDRPRSFALKNGLWLAIQTSNSADVVEALKLLTHEPANWATGLDIAEQWDSGYNVFICPPIDGWTLIATSGLCGNYEDTQKFLEAFPLLAQFPVIYAFMTNSTVGYEGLIAIKSGRIQRVFIQSEGKVEENFGEPLAEEALLYGSMALNGLSIEEATALLNDENFSDLEMIEGMQSLCGKLTGIDPSDIESLTHADDPNVGILGFVVL